MEGEHGDGDGEGDNDAGGQTVADRGEGIAHVVTLEHHGIFVANDTRTADATDKADVDVKSLAPHDTAEPPRMPRGHTVRIAQDGTVDPRDPQPTANAPSRGSSPDMPSQPVALDPELTSVDADDDGTLDESTGLLSRPAASPELEVLRGVDAGKRFTVSPRGTALGRGVDNDIILADIAVSRRHLIMRLGQRGMLEVEDLGSGNGTRINGRRVRRAAVRDGDRVDVGETLLLVHVPEDALDAEPTHRADMITPQMGARELGVSFAERVDSMRPAVSKFAGLFAGRGRFFWLAMAMVVGVALAFTHFALYYGLGTGQVEGTTLGSDEPARVKEWFRRGVSAFEERRWGDASKAFRRVLKVRPDDSAGLAYMRRIDDAQAHVRLLRRSKAALQREDAVLARKHAAAIPPTSPLYMEAQQVRREALSVELAHWVSRAERALRHSQVSRAIKALREARTLDPAAKSVKALERKLSQLGLTVSNAASPGTGSDGAGVDGGQSLGEDDASQWPRDRAQVLARYRAGAFLEAAHAAKGFAEGYGGFGARRFRRLARQIDRFADAYAAVEVGRAQASQLELALRLDQVISRGFYAGRLQGPLVEAYVREARRHFREQGVVAACGYIRRARLLEPSRPQVRKGAERCLNEATRLVAKGIELERVSVERAKATYRQVISMVSHHQVPYGTAYRRLNTLVAMGQVDEDAR